MNHHASDKYREKIKKGIDLSVDTREVRRTSENDIRQQLDKQSLTGWHDGYQLTFSNC